MENLRSGVGHNHKNQNHGTISMKTKKLSRSNSMNCQCESLIRFGVGKLNEGSGSKRLIFHKLQIWASPSSKCTTKHTRHSNIAPKDKVSS